VQLVQSFDRALHQRRCQAPPDRSCKHDDVGVEHLLQNSWPLVTLPHVALDTRLDVVIDETHDLARDIVRAETLGHDLDQSIGVRELASGTRRLEGSKQEDRS